MKKKCNYSYITLLERRGIIMIRTNLLKSKFMKAALLGLFLSTFSTGVAFADTTDSKDAAISTIAITATSSKGLSDLQAEIDQYVFVDQAEEIKAKEFMVTNTVAIDGYVEVGILPYSEDNAKFITDVFGTDQVKVVEGEDAMMYAFDEGLNTTVVDTEDVEPKADIEFDSAIFDKLYEVNDLLLDVNAKALEDKGLSIMTTVATETAVEIGVLPFTQENANYIYELVGKDLVNVVEGKEPELMATSGIATDPAAQTGEGDMIVTAYEGNDVTVQLTTDDIQAGRKASPIVMISIVAVIVLLGGTAYVLSHKKVN